MIEPSVLKRWLADRVCHKLTACLEYILRAGDKTLYEYHHGKSL